MGRTPADGLTGREAEVMDSVWRLGPATAEAVRADLATSLHDSTVRTVLRVLEAKGFLVHEVVGKAFVYRAAIERRAAQQQALGGILARFFGGRAEDLVLSLIEAERITPEQLDALRVAALGESSDADRGRSIEGATGGDSK